MAPTWAPTRTTANGPLVLVVNQAPCLGRCPQYLTDCSPRRSGEGPVMKPVLWKRKFGTEKIRNLQAAQYPRFGSSRPLPCPCWHPEHAPRVQVEAWSAGHPKEAAPPMFPLGLGPLWPSGHPSQMPVLLPLQAWQQSRCRASQRAIVPLHCTV